MLNLIISIFKASLIVAFIESFMCLIAVIALLWAFYVVYKDASSRNFKNKLENKQLSYKLNKERLKLLNKISELVALPIYTMTPNSLKFRIKSKPTIYFDINYDNEKQIENNDHSQNIFQKLKFDIIYEVIILFPNALNEYKNFIQLAEIDHNKGGITSENTNKAYDKFIEKCKTIMIEKEGN